MKTLDEYLDKIQKQESVFPVDSIHTGKKVSNYILTGEENNDDEFNEEISK